MSGAFIKRSQIDRRSGEDNRRSYNPNYFFNGGEERRRRLERRILGERRRIERLNKNESCCYFIKEIGQNYCVAGCRITSVMERRHPPCDTGVDVFFSFYFDFLYKESSQMDCIKSSRGLSALGGRASKFKPPAVHGMVVDSEKEELNP